MNVLITGANGFLGRALLDHWGCIDPNLMVALSRDDTGRIEKHSRVDHVIKGDITDFNLIRRVIADYEITHVFHLAAQSIVRICAQDPMSAYATNVMGTVNLLEAIRQVGMPRIKSIVVSTSDKAYGHAPPPYTETTPLMPKYTYEATKACQDIVSQNYFHNYGLPVKIARCSNLYGPGDPNGSRLIPNTITKVLYGGRPEIYTDVANYIREWVHVEDAVDALKYITHDGVNGEAYCVGGTDRASVMEVVQKVLLYCGSKETPNIIERTSNFKEIQEQWIDSSKLKSLGWIPHYNLDTGLKQTIESYKNGV